jgi:Ca2+-binding EF-hand superfamily protein
MKNKSHFLFLDKYYFLFLLRITMPTARDDQPDFREAFSLFDDRGDDKIPKHLFGEVVRAVGLNPTELQIKGTIQNLKTDRISFEEFLPLYDSLAKKKDNHMSEEELIEGMKFIYIYE